ncbi:MAG: hypothetical protein OXU34_02940 [Gammaproteobacteria bacterium]|nr:hypothetical protein [Gammaproteobacteria bacterium]
MTMMTSRGNFRAGNGRLKTPAACLALALSCAASCAAANDFPTSARAEFVFACMSTNGQSMEILNKCSCTIDAIAAQMKYDDYVEAETVLRMRQMQGDRVAAFRTAEWLRQAVDRLQAAQAEAEVSCF